MEDAHIASEFELPNKEKSTVFGVFDGHGGSMVSAVVKEKFMQELREQSKKYHLDFKATFEQTFLKLDTDIKDEDFADGCGTTACVVFMTDDKIYCANAGDSRAILVRKNVASKPEVVELSEDHKPDNESEMRRIEAAGAQVFGGRVDGSLAVARAIGDHMFKQNEQLPPED